MIQSNVIEANMIEAKTVSLEVLFEALSQTSLPFAVWSMPASSTFYLVLQKDKNLLKVSLDFSSHQKGFVVCPFLSVADDVYLIKSDSFHVFRLDNNSFNGEVEVDLEEEKKWQTTLALLTANVKRSNEALPQNELFAASNELTTFSNEPITSSNEPFTSSNHEASKTKFIESVKVVQEAIAQEKVQKVVLSHKQVGQLPQDYDPLNHLQKLRSAHPNAFIAWVQMEETQTWMGSSPEILLSLKENRYLETVSLAGSQPAKEEMQTSQVVWTQKEIEEQAYVSRYIIDCLKSIRLRQYQEDGPKTVKAGALFHLKSCFKVDLTQTEVTDVPNRLIRILHPTSAVCGMPLQAARLLIDQLETHARSLYAGFWGPHGFYDHNQIQQSHFFVNIRTLQLLEEYFCAYAGAGITEDSIPLKEWEEIEFKIESIISLL